MRIALFKIPERSLQFQFLKHGLKGHFAQNYQGFSTFVVLVKLRSFGFCPQVASGI